MQEVHDRMNDESLKYDLSSERWRKAMWTNDLGENHKHLLEFENDEYPQAFLIYHSEEHCVFCQADSTYDRTLKEILYYFDVNPGAAGFGPHMTWHKTLISKWKNNVDAWGNPIGNNIKG